MLRLSLLMSLPLLICGSLQAQQSTQEEMIRVTTDLVVVDARVVDEKTGLPVNGLRPDDFEIYEDGVRQEITHFSRDRLPLSIVIMLDVSGSMQNVIDELYRDALRVLLSLNPEDEVALVAYGSDTQLLQDFTKDRRLIVNKIGTANESYTGGRGTSLAEAVFQASAYLAPGKNPGSRRILIGITDDIGHELFFRHTKRQALDQLMDSAASLYGLSVVDQDSWARDHPLSSGPVGRFIGHSDDERLRYFADPTGGVVLPAMYGAVAARLRDLLGGIRASYTLGYIPSNRQMNGEFRKIQVKLKNPRVVDEHTGEGIKPAVVARKGYFAGIRSPENRSFQRQAKSIQQPVMDVSFADRAPVEQLSRQAYFVPQGPRDFGSEVLGAIFLNPLGEFCTRLYISLGPKIRLKGSAGKYTAKFDALVMILSETGMIIAGYREDLQLSSDEANREFLTSGGGTGISIGLPPGNYQVRAAFLELGSGRISTARASLEVWSPSKELPIISSIVLSRRNRASDQPPAGVDDYDPLRLGKETVIPSLDDWYPSEGSLTAFFHVYNVDDQYQYRLKLYHDQVLCSSTNPRPVQSEYRHAVHGYLLAPRLSLSGLIPGNYRLEVEVALADGSNRVSRSTSFRVK